MDIFGSGNTIEEAQASLVEGLKGYIDFEISEGRSIPSPSTIATAQSLSTCREAISPLVPKQRESLDLARVRVGRCRGTLALDDVKFRRWAAQHSVEIPGPPRLREGAKWNPPPRCPICDARMALRHNKAKRSAF